MDYGSGLRDDVNSPEFKPRNVDALPPCFSRVLDDGGRV